MLIFLDSPLIVTQTRLLNFFCNQPHFPEQRRGWAGHDNKSRGCPSLNRERLVPRQQGSQTQIALRAK